MSPFINTAWPRFFFGALPFALFAVLLNSTVDAPQHGWLIQTSLLLAPFSILVFLGLGWQRLRKAHAEYPILKRRAAADAGSVDRQREGGGAVVWPHVSRNARPDAGVGAAAEERRLTLKVAI
ncbi:hypothetical protein [Stenotrophomonas maltophilia]|uniref:hypothetical protein n=1 Tax=Stenotrophomonas maltophilia TaxID=40324 RepID=UPI001EE465E6|nr:hypothetical protein [Stenotrophomonas maltophilia]